MSDYYTTIYYNQNGLVREIFTMREYCVFTIHDILESYLPLYRRNVMEIIYRIKGETEPIEIPSDYNYDSKTHKTTYTSHYEYHRLVVSVYRNTDNYFEMCATIEPNTADETPEIQHEKDFINEIAFSGIIQRVKEHGCTVAEFVDICENHTQEEPYIPVEDHKRGTIAKTFPQNDDIHFPTSLPSVASPENFEPSTTTNTDSDEEYEQERIIELCRDQMECGFYR